MQNKQVKNKGVLYLVPTPIGNIKDISERAKEVFSSVSYIACEDTRVTSKLLSLLNIKNKTFSCHEHNEIEASNKIIKDLLDGLDVAYSSDAGMPCISDPGEKLVKACIKNDINVVPLPGSNAALTALIASGFNTSHFYFYGFLDSKNSKKSEELHGLLKIKDPIVFYESPLRVNETLKEIYSVFGNRKIVIARELTKIYEEYIRSDLEALIKENRVYKGEIVLIIEGNNKEEKINIEEKFEKLKANNFSNKDITIILSTLYKISKNEIKKYLLENN